MTDETVSRYADLGVPNSWYRVAWSHELRPGAVLPLSYFGREMVAYRTDRDSVVVMDAFCKHLGAHLGHGGIVEGDRIVCPFHGWEWGPDGRNVCIPYATTTVKQAIPTYHVREVNGMVWVWYDADGGPPGWEVPVVPEYGDDSFVPFAEDACRTWANVGVHPLQSTENTADAAHIRFVHGAGVIPELDDFEERGPVFHSMLKYWWGADAPSTWLTPNGPVLGVLDAECHGMGLILTRYNGIPQTVQITGCTPIDSSRSDYYTALLITREAGEALREKMIRQFFRDVEADFPIWENMCRVDRPPLPQLESKIIRAFRKWSTQFFA